MFEICQKILDMFGRDAVIKFCDAIGWQTWEVCDSCESESPITDEPESYPVCLLCGDVIGG